MALDRRPLRLYTQVSEHPPLEWSWVEGQLVAAPTYWIVAPSETYPHPRPVWGAWIDQRLHLSVGSPALRRVLAPGATATVHLDSGTDVVIVEGEVVGGTSEAEVIDAYDGKYDWTYDVAEYGPLTTIEPVSVLAWRTTGWAGRDSFQQTARWSRDG